MPDPISAVLPIFNCRERLARHLESVKIWAPQVEEIIVVDSGSSDGSLELAQTALSPFSARFVHNPRAALDNHPHGELSSIEQQFLAVLVLAVHQPSSDTSPISSCPFICTECKLAFTEWFFD